MQQLDDVTGYAGRSRDALPLLLPKLLKEENLCQSPLKAKFLIHF